MRLDNLDVWDKKKKQLGIFIYSLGASEGFCLGISSSGFLQFSFEYSQHELLSLPLKGYGID